MGGLGMIRAPTLVLVCLASTVLPAACRDKGIDNLVKWAKSHGAALDDVEIETKADGQRGLVATRSMMNGTVAVSIPPKLVMCPTSFTETPLGKFITADEKLAASISMDETSMLTVMLLCEAANPESHWAPYIAALPKSTLGGLQLTDADMDSLNGTLSKSHLEIGRETLHSVVQSAKGFYDKHTTMVQEYCPGADFSVKNVEWATGIVQSRSQVVSDDETHDIKGIGKVPINAQGCLCPILDMMNHRPNANTIGANGVGIGQVLKRDVKKGDEVFTNYGALGLEIAHINYGFSTVEMSVNLADKMRDLMQESLSDTSKMIYGGPHAENTAKILMEKKCMALDNFAHAGVLGWRMLKKVMQCTRILKSSPPALETLVRREFTDKATSAKPYNFGAEVSMLEEWVKIFKEQQRRNAEWENTTLAKAPLESLTPGQQLVRSLRKAEALFVNGHFQEVNRLFIASPQLMPVLKKADTIHEKIRQEKGKFKLTADHEADEAKAAAEEKIAEEKLQGSFDQMDVDEPEDNSYDEF